MAHLNLRRDGFVLLLLAVMAVLLLAALTGSYRLFGFGLVAFLGMLMWLGFARRGDPVTWVPPLAGAAVLLAAFAGIFTYETSPVRDPADTILGFQRGTAFLVYGIWIPAFVTMGVGFAWVFDRLARDEDSSARGTGGRG